MQRLYEYVKAEFSQTWLPSHDHTHHMRVWSYAKILTEVLNREGHHFSKTKLEQLIIAVFFHDTGLTRTLDASHGKESREICRKFLARQPNLLKDHFDEMLDAVEKHDDKSYGDFPVAERNQPDDILTMLTVCDDLDAYGAIGVFRYLEIYFHRGIPFQLIPVKVIVNLKKRHQYLIQHYGDLKDFILAQQNRYQFTVDFYNALGKQQHAPDNISPNEGPLIVANLLLEKVLREKIHITEIAFSIENLPLDEYTIHYFRQLQSELK